MTGRITGEAASVNNPFQTIERRDVGISLQVVPVVTPAGLLIMDVKTNADSISDSQAASDIITNTRSISTTVQLKSGQTVLLGGMVDNRDSEADSSVPWLSKIPLIGALFTSKAPTPANERCTCSFVPVSLIHFESHDCRRSPAQRGGCREAGRIFIFSYQPSLAFLFLMPSGMGGALRRKPAAKRGLRKHYGVSHNIPITAKPVFAAAGHSGIDMAS